MKTKAELIEEIKQISTQYHSEVGRDRKAWPKAIKERITELFLAGAKATEVANATGLPYFTVLKWRPEGFKGAPRGKCVSNFRELAVVDPKVATVTVVQKQDDGSKKVGTVTVTTSGGTKIEGSVESIIEILKSGVA